MEAIWLTNYINVYNFYEALYEINSSDGEKLNEDLFRLNLDAGNFLLIIDGLDEVISKAKGFRGYKVNKGIESPERYVLMIFWDTLENHTIDFRESPAFLQWRAIVGSFFSSPPIVEHFSLLGKSV